MAESETRNARGEVVEQNEDGRWVPVDSKKEETTAPENPVPAEGEVLEDKGDSAPASRTTDKDK